ncbi:hypothetical protein KIPB_008736 [Kipferlia bialata]|uniref:Uncharacterized protein n=1 Tax=Kipferlia bialata TaxID=797122 RepID=A0A9K3D2C3_9EUKA|nr:hypothetical protein KIPB_008736 [Kipferlia bialata]|eukprot:g8736.t1
MTPDTRHQRVPLADLTYWTLVVALSSRLCSTSIKPHRLLCKSVSLDTRRVWDSWYRSMNGVQPHTG